MRRLPQQNKPKAIAIAGPTAVGKTALSVRLAEMLGGEIICCDSMQIYRYMDIGTAKVTEEEMHGIKHHMLGFLTPDEKYSAADYARDAIKVVEDVVSRGKTPIFCGGTGLYLEAVRTGRHTDNEYLDPEYRKELERISEEPDGAHSLHLMLEEIDPQSALAIHENNVRRVIRALEICRASGEKKSVLDLRSKEKPNDVDMLVYVLNTDDREILRQRIFSRVDCMISAGLAEETEFLYRKGYLDGKTTASQAIGYKELIPYIEGNESLESCVRKLKYATVHYAKRQLTWFSAVENAKQLIINDGTRIKTPAELSEEIYGEITCFLRG